jgi:hypothetical protein
MATLKEATLGGLPATKFIGRQIKVAWNDKDQHPSTCKCISVDGDTVVVVVGGGRGARTHRVPLSRCKPWWSQNPDLKAEAEAVGALFNGEVSVGRAFEAAEHPKAEDKIKAGTLAPVKVSPLPEAPKTDQAVILKPVVIPQRPATAPPPAAEQPQGPRKLARLTIPMERAGGWIPDLQEYYRVRAEQHAGAEELDTLRARIQELQQELELKTSAASRNQEENTLMMDLLIEQLEAKGVVFHWEGETPAPAAIPKVEDEFFEKARAWMDAQTKTFTFDDLFFHTQQEDTPPHRAKIKRYCDRVGITRVSRQGPGAKTTFTPNR